MSSAVTPEVAAGQPNGATGADYPKAPRPRSPLLAKITSLTSIATFAAAGMMVIGVIAIIGGNYDKQVVRDQLTPQKIFFPPAGSPALLPGVKQYAGQQLVNGAQAKAYANNFINVHLSKVAGGKTYAEVSTAALADPKNATAGRAEDHPVPGRDAPRVASQRLGLERGRHRGDNRGLHPSRPRGRAPVAAAGQLASQHPRPSSGRGKRVESQARLAALPSSAAPPPYPSSRSRAWRSATTRAEAHLSQRSNWLRAAVLGANDGIVSVASLVLGVAASGASVKAIVTAGVRA